jgi:hypothetical protein
VSCEVVDGMNRKICAVLPILLLSLWVSSTIIGTAVRAGSSSISAHEYPSVYISPENVASVNVGDVFTVTVGVSGLSDENLYGFDIVLKWDSDAVEYVAHEAKVPVETYSEGVLHQPVIEIKNEVDTSVGIYWLACASLLPAEPFNEDGVFFTVTFVLLKESANPFALDVILGDHHGEIIRVNGSENPEVSSASLGSIELTEARKSRFKKWLEWWITVTWHIPKCAQYPNS